MNQDGRSLLKHALSLDIALTALSMLAMAWLASASP